MVEIACYCKRFVKISLCNRKHYQSNELQTNTLVSSLEISVGHFTFVRKSGMLCFFMQETHLNIFLGTRCNFHRQKCHSGIQRSTLASLYYHILIFRNDLPIALYICLVDFVSQQLFLVYCFALLLSF